jgi:hypothetical protein
MEPWLRDTDPRAQRVYVDTLRRMTPERKLAAALEMSDAIRRLAEDGVRGLYSRADEREVFLRTAARFLDRETMLKVYGWAPEDEP